MAQPARFAPAVARPTTPPRLIRCPVAPALLLAAAAAAHAQTPTQTQPTQPDAPPPAAQQIEITGGRETATEERRRSTAAKIVIGRDEIDRYGDATLGEVLRRLPGVTTPGAPGRGGPPRMRGLGNGYTQLLLDGQRVPPGFSFESLTPDQVERIEILRAPTAETGARAIAGTINIVTREGYRRRSNEVRLGSQFENGNWSPGGSWTRNDAVGAMTYNVSLSAFASRRRSEGSTRTTDTANADDTLLLDQTEAYDLRERRQGLNLTSRLQWRLGESGDALVLTPTLFVSRSHGDRALQLTQDVPATTLPLYDSAAARNDGSFGNGRLNALWRQRLTPASRLELNAAAGLQRARSETRRDEFRNRTVAPLRSLTDATTARERTLNASAKLLQTLGGDNDTGAGASGDAAAAHSVTSGVEAEAFSRSETRANTQLDAGEGDNLQADSLRLAAYAQDEWSLSPHWSAHAGLRWEGIATRGSAADGTRPDNRSSVWTPLLHAVWKPDPKGRDQLRISLTRSYRSPPLSALIAQPSVNNKYPVGGANQPTAPDRAGNPGLRPEIATGVDIAAERYLDGGGLISANVFRRNVHDLLRSVTALETVAYSPAQRYVARQQNVGDAVAQGVELEAKFALDQLLTGAPRVDLRSNLSLFRSRVDGVPGPDDRLDQQPKATGNVGADYRFRALPLTVGGNVNWVPGYATQLSPAQRTDTGTKRIVDVYALWTFSPALALRVLANNLGPRDYDSANTIATDTFAETARSSGPSYTNWQLRLELRL